jgi:hypothetical protein
MLVEQCPPWIVLQLFGHELICPSHGGTQEITKADQEQEDQCSPFQQSFSSKEASFRQGRLDYERVSWLPQYFLRLSLYDAVMHGGRFLVSP